MQPSNELLLSFLASSLTPSWAFVLHRGTRVLSEYASACLTKAHKYIQTLHDLISQTQKDQAQFPLPICLLLIK